MIMKMKMIMKIQLNKQLLRFFIWSIFLSTDKLIFKFIIHNFLEKLSFYNDESFMIQKLRVLL